MGKVLLPLFDTVALLLADTKLTYSIISANKVIRAGGYQYQVMASNAITHDLTTAGGIKLRVLREDGNYYVTAFGAKGDASTDDSAAIQLASDAATRDLINSIYVGDPLTVNGGPTVIFPRGTYRMNTPLSLGITARYVDFRGVGKVVILGDTSKTKGINFANGLYVRHLVVEGIHFQNFATVWNISNANIDFSSWYFERVIASGVTMFLDSGSYVTSRSTIVSFVQCTFTYSVAQILRIFCDSVNFYGGWIGSGTGSSDSIVCNSFLTFYGTIFIPSGVNAGGRAVVRLTNDDGAGGTVNDVHRGVVFHGGRASNESGQGPLVVCDFPLAEDNRSSSPTIVLDAITMAGYHAAPYEEGNSEVGIVHLLKYPASVSISNCGTTSLYNAQSVLVSKVDSLSIEDAPDGFSITVDEATYRNAKRSSGEISNGIIAASLKGFVNNPDPYTFRNVAENGNLIVGDSSTSGRKKSSFTLTSGFSDSDYSTPITFMLFLGGQGAEGGVSNDVGFSGTSVYLVSVSFGFSGSHKAKIAYTKLHGDTFGGSTYSCNADIVSMHFGTGDTGSDETARATSYDVTVVFGTNVKQGKASFQPGFIKTTQRGLSVG